MGIQTKFDMKVFLFLLDRDLSIDLLNTVSGCKEEIWMLCARCSGSTSSIEKVHQMVSLLVQRAYSFEILLYARD